MGTATAAERDDYLFAQKAPEQTIEYQPEFYSARLVTPIGRLSYATLAKPKVIRNPDGGQQPPKYTCTLLMNPDACEDLWEAVYWVADQTWRDQSIPAALAAQKGIIKADEAARLGNANVRVKGSDLMVAGILHCPLRDGNDTFIQDAVKYASYRDTTFFNGSASEERRPYTCDEQGNAMEPEKLYSGCYARMFITLFAFPKPGQQSKGKRGVSVWLNSVQFARHGVKLAGFDSQAAAKAAFGQAPIPVATDGGNGHEPGFGPNMKGGPGRRQPATQAAVLRLVSAAGAGQDIPWN